MIRVFIIEDELYIRKGLKIQLKELDKGLEIVGEAASVKEALIKVEKIKPSLILLDIKLLDGSAFDFLDQTKFNDYNVIIITSYDSYAIQALKHGAVDYILKPIDIDELSNAIDKVIANQAVLKSSTSENKIFLNFINGSQIIVLEELVFCKSHKGYTTFYMKNGKEFLSSKPLKEYENQLQNNDFIRTHQSYFVNSKLIEKFDSKNRKLHLLGNIEVPVSARKISLINSYFNI
jgi:two-component system LytT family response regulator